MKAIIWYTVFLLYTVNAVYAQNNPEDSLMTVQLGEVIVINKPLLNHHKQSKPLSSLDEYLNQSSKVIMIKRGNYAWEPMVNNMSGERIVVTIDGMHIFGACTDKMDPVTSYVDVSNLSEVAVSSGQQGAENGPTIGGAIDLTRTKHDFCHTGWSGSLDAGYESNANLYTLGADLKYVHQRFFINTDFMYRDAGNYKAGGKTKVPFSQFTKYNFSSIIGVKLNEKNRLTGSFIVDNAKDVGYPALPMDVAKARAFITSLEHRAENVSPFIEALETKVYYNTILHEMDDTKRPEVPIHMDMPGWSNTLGMYEKLKATKGKHALTINLNGYYNQSKAEMTMYPKDTTEQSMFMYTWPDVRTVYTGVYFQDKINWKQVHSLQYSAGTGWHHQLVASEFGLNSLRIFYPEMPAEKNRPVCSAQVGYGIMKHGLEWTLGVGYGERAPSVSEAYGFYLYNSFDGYDYIGNPYLKNEKSIELQTSLSYKQSKIKANLSAAYFHMFDYIIGIHQPELSPMTIGASGVRVYQSLKAADMLNTELSLDYRPHPSWRTKAAFMYSYGRDNQKNNLPLIRPFSFRMSVAYKIKSLDMELSVNGAAKQYAYSKTYGEDETPAYAILNFSAGYVFFIEQHRLYLSAGIENMADTYYSTFSDWNNIPSKGRNFFINVSFSFDKQKKDSE